jgi:hypothetical protein
MSRNPLAPVTTSVSPELYERSKEDAKAVGMQALSHYARYAIQLFNMATTHGFSPTETSLLTLQGESLPLPSVIDKNDAISGETIRVWLDPRERRELFIYAQFKGISPVERVRRSLRFTNFLVENIEPTYYSADFLHRDECIPVPRATTQPR